MKLTHPLLKYAPLFLIIFIDTMGLGLVLPLLNTLIVNSHSHFLFYKLTPSDRDIIYSVIFCAYMICWFFGSAILGDLSDKIGRKKSLFICLLGAFFGYSLAAVAIAINSLFLLFISRIISGLTAGSQAIAQAAIIDISNDENRARNIGLILMFVSLGFVFGPILGGVFSDSNLVSWFNFSTPFILVAILALINLFLLLTKFSETHPRQDKLEIHFHRAITVFTSAFKQKLICRLVIMRLFMIFGWSNFFVFIPLYMSKLYHFNTIDNSLFFAVMGLGFAIGCGYSINFFLRFFSLKMTCVSALLIAVLFMLLMLLVPFLWVVWLSTFLIGVGIATALSTILAIFSHQVPKDEQGWIMGVNSSIASFGFGVTALISGFIIGFNVHLPIYLAIFGLFASAMLLVKIKLKPSN